MESKEKCDLYWIVDHETLCWAPGKVFKDIGTELHVQCIVDNECYSLEKPALEVHPSCLEGVNDLLSLGEFNEGALLHNIRVRYHKQQIYTSIGTPILLSVNPYQKLKIFTSFVARKYREYSKAVRSGQDPQKPDPHLFMVAEESYQDMLIDNKNQSIIISGESGAGKTEATKIILCYLAKANTNFVGQVDEDMLEQRKQVQVEGHPSIEKQVLDSNPLLEAFGNAKTFKNNNSSRFGKFIQVNFESSGKIHSASIVNYLLEKSRIVFQQGVERNFHIFFQLMSTDSIVKKYQLGQKEEYHYINQSGVYTVKDVDDGEDFRVTINCMRNIGFTELEIDSVLDIVVAILLLGNIEFSVISKPGMDETVVSKECQGLLAQASSLLKVEPAQLQRAMTTKVSIIGKEMIKSPLNKSESYNSRDAMAKAIYGNMFNWIVKRINQSISQKLNAKSTSKLKFIGLLDIFGFEIFQENSFEQLCINYANEKLQQHFNNHMFTMEQEEYKKENIKWDQIKFVDNQQCIDLIESPKNPSIFKLLDEECMIKGDDNKLIKKYNDILQGNKSFKRPSKFGACSFIVCHYAGEVEYQIPSFIEKNKDTVSEVINETMLQSKNVLLATLFVKEPAAEPAPQQKGFGPARAQGAGLKGNSLSNQFRTQLNDLLQILRESSPRYIRCIKPNSKFSPTDFESFDVCKQLRCAGMLEAIRIRKAGYAIRMGMDDFAKRYRAILDKKKAKGLSSREVGEQIFVEVNKMAQFKKVMDPAQKRWQIGITKIFLKEEVRTVLEQAMGIAVLQQAKHIQRLWKGFKARKLFRLMRASMAKIKHHLRKYVRRRRFRKVVEAVKKKMVAAIRRLQKVAKWRWRRKMVFVEVEKRIEKKRREEEERRRREEEERRRKEEEERRKQEEERRRQEEELRRQEEQQRREEGQRRHEEDMQREEELRQESSREEGRMRLEMAHRREEFSQFSDSREVEGSGRGYGSSKNSQPYQASTFSEQHKRSQMQILTTDENDGSSSARTKFAGNQPTRGQKDDRFQKNMDRISRQMFADGGELEKLIELEKKLKEKSMENEELQKEVGELKQVVEERDKKIRELTIRIETRNKFGGNELTIGGDTKFESSFAVSEDLFLFGSGNKIPEEFSKQLESKEEELQSLKAKFEQNKVIWEAESSSKDSQIEALKEENDQLTEKNKRWMSKLDGEIEKNSQMVNRLTKQIQELQEKNYKLEYEERNMRSEMEKKAFKDQADEAKKLENELREKNDVIDELEMIRFNLEERFAKEQSQMQNELDKLARLRKEAEAREADLKQEVQNVEVQLIEKDEIAKKYEEENVVLTEQIKLLVERLEELGENKQSMMENLKNEKSQSSKASSKLKEVQSELEKFQGIDKVRQAELERLKCQVDSQKKKMKDLEDQNESLIEKNYQLKKERAEMENNLLFKDSGGSHAINDFEKQKLREKVEELQDKMGKVKHENEALNTENNFYHQTTTVFLTIKKIIDKEKKFCFMFAEEQNVLEKKRLMDAIHKCREQVQKLDLRLKTLLEDARKHKEQNS